MDTETVKIVASRQRFRLTARWQTGLLVAVDCLFLIVVAWVWTVSVVGVLLLLFTRWRLGLYRARFSLSSLDELPVALVAGLIAAGALAVLGVPPWLDVTVTDVALVVAAGLLLGLLRAPVYVAMRALRRGDVAREQMLLVGGGVVADAIADMAEDNANYGLDLAGRIPDLLDVDLVQAAALTRATTVVVAFSRASEASEVHEMRRGLAAGLKIMVVPRYFDLIGDSSCDDHVFGVPVRRLGAGRPTIGLVIKRGMDVLLSLVALVLLAPILLVAGLLVKRETGAGMLFKQSRIGMGGRSFDLLKLQTMKPVAGDQSDTEWSVNPDGDRLGPVGSFLRKTSIDELPQLWNILRGDMSFVGPRPERPFFVEQFSDEYPGYQDRLRMPAGLTGLAQIHDLRGDTSIGDRARFDNRYEDSWSLWLDLKIILKTVPKVLPW
jgi:lipopolysaccharide/colanic/teichoic acid biosynthesis glycosyltransferase